MYINDIASDKESQLKKKRYLDWLLYFKHFSEENNNQTDNNETSS